MMGPLVGVSVPLAEGDGALGALGPSAVVAFRGANVIVVDEVVVDAALFVDNEASFVDRVRLLLAKVSEKKKQLLTMRINAVTLRHVDVDLKICMGFSPFLKSVWDSLVTNRS